MKEFFRWLALAFAILFALACFVQLNDPDAFIWIVIYAIPCLASLSFFLRRFNYTIGLLLGIGYFIGGIVVWPESYEGILLDDGNLENIERGREALGLFIIALMMFIFTYRTRAEKRSKI
ncbi:MAG: hypothetical protein HKP53_03465 [Eudoraea sp.]|nr:hypothetical protein [Eudoraea sp.]